MDRKLESEVQDIDFNLTNVPRADVIPHDLYKELREYRAWKDASQNSDVLVSRWFYYL